jgi:hypothetical protein
VNAAVHIQVMMPVDLGSSQDAAQELPKGMHERIQAIMAQQRWMSCPVFVPEMRNVNSSNEVF